MTRVEFEEWTEFHCMAFPKLREDFATNTRSLAQWFGALKRVRLSSAKDATMEMLGDGVKFGEHVSTIKAYAKKYNGMEGEATAPQKRYIDGERVYTCNRCMDSGHNYVFGPKSMASMKKGPSIWIVKPTDYLICGCDCEWGRKVGYVQRLVPYDPTKLVRWEFDDRDAVERLAMFCGVTAPIIVKDQPYERPAHVQPVVEQTAPERPLASLLAASKAIVPVSAGSDDGRVYDESEYDPSTEGPWTPDMDISF